MKARPLLVEVAPALIFAFEELDAALHRRIALFCRYFVGRGLAPSLPALRLIAGPPPADGSPDDPVDDGPGYVEEGIRVRRRAAMVFLEVAGIRAWYDIRPPDPERPDVPRAGIELGNPTDQALDHFTWTALATLLFEVAQHRGWLGLHAAALAVDGRGILLPGASGSGKSTIFRGAHQAALDGQTGLRVLSDDLVWLEEDAAGDFRVHAFPRAWPEGRRPGPAVPEPTLNQAVVEAVVCPAIVEQADNHLIPLSLPDLLATLTAECGFRVTGTHDGARFRQLVRLARRVPAHRLAAGRDLRAVAPLLERLMRDTRPGSAA